MTLVLAILGSIPALYGILTFVEKIFKKTPQEKVIDIIADTDAAMKKAKETGDTSDVENLINH